MRVDEARQDEPVAVIDDLCPWVGRAQLVGPSDGRDPPPVDDHRTMGFVDCRLLGRQDEWVAREG